MVSEINILTKKMLNNMLYFYNYLYKFWENACFFDKFAMKNNLQIKMQSTFYLMACKNIDFDHERHVIMYR